LGSSWLANCYSGWLSTFDICLALDRRGTQDVIVTQSWGLCASDEFAEGLSTQLGMDHMAADGIFTDSANYTDLIPECSNLSIGYEHEHSTKEMLDLNYLEAVIKKLIAVDWNKIPIARVPGDNGAEAIWSYLKDDGTEDPYVTEEDRDDFMDWWLKESIQ